MELSNLKPQSGSVTSKKKRLGRGQGSGKGGTATRGHKGAKSRSGYSKKLGFEGVTTIASAKVYANGDKDDLIQNIGLGYDHNVSGITLGTDINYNIDAEDWTPTAHVSFSF